MNMFHELSYEMLIINHRKYRSFRKTLTSGSYNSMIFITINLSHSGVDKLR